MPKDKKRSRRVDTLERNLGRCVNHQVIEFMKRRYEEAFRLLEDD